jgi:hypothetical protein
MVPISICPIRLLIFERNPNDGRLLLKARRMYSSRFLIHLNNYEELIIKIKLNNVGIFRICYETAGTVLL